MLRETTVRPDRLAEFEGWQLLKGNHSKIEDGACALEAAAYIAGEPHTDHPELRAALKPTTLSLQDSAFELLDRLIAEGEAA